MVVNFEPSRRAFAGQLEHYVTSVPSARNAVEIFKGEWNSGLPGELSKDSGRIPTFDDQRLKWALDVLGGVEGQHILELGPLEGGHTWMLEQAGAAGIVAVEANVRAYLKCLIVKEILAMSRARFLLGDFLEYLRTDPGSFDLAVASGVLYHTEHPVELMSRLAAVAPRVFVWTHYFDEARFRELPEGAAGLEPVQSEFGGFRCTMHRLNYLPPPRLSGFCGGGSSHAYWLSREDIFACFRHAGLSKIEIAFDEVGHAMRPRVARRPESAA